jgi:dihydropteroate synthase
MGVINITPDSFSDGGRWLEPERAVEHGLAMVEAGANLLDLGAESTRPGGGTYGDGAATVPEEEELQRLLPVLRKLRAQTQVPISVDTRKGRVAREALAGGADLINDVGALADAELGAAVAQAGCPLVLMHSRGDLSTMQASIRFEDLLVEVRRELLAALRRAEDAGIASEQVILDPGIGFGKNTEQNLTLIRRLDFLRDLGRPLLLGASRKSFIGKLTGAPAQERLAGSLAAAAWAAAQDVQILRVHDVAETVQFLQVWTALARAGEAAQ